MSLFHVEIFFSMHIIIRLRYYTRNEYYTSMRTIFLLFIPLPKDCFYLFCLCAIKNLKAYSIVNVTQKMHRILWKSLQDTGIIWKAYLLLLLLCFFVFVFALTVFRMSMPTDAWIKMFFVFIFFQAFIQFSSSSYCSVK